MRGRGNATGLAGLSRNTAYLIEEGEMGRERILITVKTYPTLSSSYGELVCTAGLRENGSWIRIYPVPFRLLDEYKKFTKYQFIEANVIRNSKDPRVESHKVDFESLKITGEKLNTKDCWQQRRNWVLGRGQVYDDLAYLIEAANVRNELSLATFKPAEIIDFIAQPVSGEWDQEKVLKIQQESRQLELFDEWEPVKLTKSLNKVPWKFSYRLRDAKGKESTMMIEDWEIGALYWNCLKDCGVPEAAVKKVREKYFDLFCSKDLYLYLGTTREWHGRGKNPFVVIGVFWPPYQNQQDLFL